MEWMLMPLKRYADFSGRSRRQEFWMFALLKLIVFGVLGVVAGVAAVGWLHGETSGVLFFSVLTLIALLFLALMVPTWAVTARRFHDQGMTGWLVLLNLIPSLGPLIILVFMCMDGQVGANPYGSDPKQRA